MRRYLAVSLTVKRLCIGEKQQLARQSASIFAGPSIIKFIARVNRYFSGPRRPKQSALPIGVILLSCGSAQRGGGGSLRDWTRRRSGLTIPTFMSALFFKRFLQRP